MEAAARHRQTISIGTSGAAWRVALGVVVVCAVVCGYFAVKWCAASVFAENAINLEVAQTAVALSPSDPRTQYAVGRYFEKQSSQTATGDYGVEYFTRAVALSPFDYRLWLRLAAAREQARDFAASERAFRRAIELAPAYYAPHWEYGNFLLRRNRTDEAFAELRRAAETDPRVLQQLFNIALRTFDEDFNRAADAIAANSTASRFQLIDLLNARQKFAEARRLWSQINPNELNAADKQTARDVGTRLLGALYDAKQFTSAFEIYTQLYNGDTGLAGGKNNVDRIAPAQFINGGFEQDVAVGLTATRFGWYIVAQPQAQIYVDANTRHEGARSLGINFNAPREFTFPSVMQAMIVRPGRTYQLEFYYRTHDLQTAATMFTEVIDASSNAVIAASSPISSDTQDWQKLTAEFRAPPNTQAVTVRLMRTACPATTCPIYGRVWFDDFRLLER